MLFRIPKKVTTLGKINGQQVQLGQTDFLSQTLQTVGKKTQQAMCTGQSAVTAAHCELRVQHRAVRTHVLCWRARNPRSYFSNLLALYLVKKNDHFSSGCVVVFS